MEIRKVEDLEDGSSVYEVGPKAPKPSANDDSFSKNLAISMSEASLKTLSNYLLDAIKEDIEARKGWLDAIDEVKKYLGFGLEDLENVPFKEATRTFDSTLATALVRGYSKIRGELFPESGPAGYRIKGVSNEIVEKRGEQRRDKLNNYLTIIDKPYYPDCEKFSLYFLLCGSGFKKVYPDKILNRPLSRFIHPRDFIVNGDCTSILESTRITHVLHLSKREIILNQKNGIYRDVELKHLKLSDSQEGDEEDDDTEAKKKDGVDLSVYSKRSLSPIYEIHTYLDLDEITDPSISKTENNVPLPYVVAIDIRSKEILYVRNNWDPHDPERKAINYFVQYNYIPGFGIYGIGLAHLIGCAAINLTTILRQLIDAGKFKNLPAGLRAKGFGQQKTDNIVGPGEWLEVDTGGLPLEQAFMPLPYSEPSGTLFELLRMGIDQAKELASTSEMGMMDSREDIAPGTAYAFLEVQNLIQSAVLRSYHNSLSQELQLLDKLLNPDLTEEDEVGIIPVSDPSINSTVQRIARAEAIRNVALQAPELHNMTEVFKLSYAAFNLNQKDIDKILKPDPEQTEQEVLPLDPITENMNASNGLPLKAAIWQEHAAHKLVHGLYAQQYPDLQPNLMAHIKEHDAFEYLVQMQQLIGAELPPLEQIADPQVQNSIALAIAGALSESGMMQQGEQAETVDPNAILMAEIQAKEAETAAKERIANVRAETDIFKAQLDFEKEKAKIESNEDIAKLKSETELTKQEYSNG